MCVQANVQVWIKKINTPISFITLCACNISSSQFNRSMIRVTTCVFAIRSEEKPTFRFFPCTIVSAEATACIRFLILYLTRDYCDRFGRNDVIPLVIRESTLTKLEHMSRSACAAIIKDNQGVGMPKHSMRGDYNPEEGRRATKGRRVYLASRYEGENE